MTRYLALALGALLLSPGCASHSLGKIEYGYCAPPSPEETPPREDPPPPKGAPRTAHLAALLGLSAAFEERESGSLSLETRVRVLERIGTARIAISASIAELDCEGERLGQAADALIRRQATTVQTLTIASVLTAAATAVTGVFLATANASSATQDVVTVAGSGVTAGLGIGALLVNPTVHVEHSRNLIEELWQGPSRATMYPAVVWAYLSRPVFSNSQEVSIREQIIDRWRRSGQVTGDADSVLRFTRTGAYDADELRTLRAMLSQIVAEVALENQELKALAEHLLTP